MVIHGHPGPRACSEAFLTSPDSFVVLESERKRRKVGDVAVMWRRWRCDDVGPPLAPTRIDHVQGFHYLRQT